MKKLLVVCAMLCAAFGAQAQEENQWEVKAGIGISDLAGENAKADKPTISYKIGVGYNVNFSESWGIEPAVMFANKAFKEDGIDGVINRFALEIPVLAAYKISLSDNTKLIINAGPYVSFGLFGSDLEYPGGSINIYDKDMFNRFEAGIQAGAKVAFNKFSVGIDYQRGFTKVVSDVKGYTWGAGLTVGYAF